jgi:hypothetical protein
MSHANRGEKGPDFLYRFRDVDKVAAGLTDGEIIVLYTLLAHRNYHTGVCNVSLPTLAKNTGRSKRQLQRIIGGLGQRGILIVTPGHHHVPSSYAFHLDTLPLTQGGHPDVTPESGHNGVTPEGGQSGHPERSEWTSGEVRVDIRSTQSGHLDVTLRREEEEKKQKKGAPEAPSAAAAAEIGFAEREALEIAKTVARDMNRPMPSETGKASRQALASYVADALTAARGDAKTAKVLFRRRMEKFYECDDSFYANKNWALPLAKQIAQPAIRRREPEAKPAEPEPGALTGAAAAEQMGILKGILSKAGIPPYERSQ